MDNLSRLPRHVSLIMDGNGRWALQRGKERVDGHIEGVNSVREVMKTSLELGIEYISFFAFSEENWGRPQEEVNCLMELIQIIIMKMLSMLNLLNVPNNTKMAIV